MLYEEDEICCRAAYCYLYIPTLILSFLFHLNSQCDCLRLRKDRRYRHDFNDENRISYLMFL